MRRRNLEIMFGRLIIIDCFVGLGLSINLGKNLIEWRELTMFPCVLAIYTIVYYWLNNKYVKQLKSGVLSRSWQFTILMNMTGMLLISLVFLQPYSTNYEGNRLYGYIALQYVLPALIVLEYLCGPRHIFQKKHILPAMIYMLVYNGIAIGLGLAGYGLGLNGTYPYPFINVKQLGLPIVGINVVLLTILSYMYGWILVKIDWRKTK